MAAEAEALTYTNFSLASGLTRVGMTNEKPSCDGYMRMPFNEEVIEHLRSCDSCRAVFNQLVDETERLKYGFEHRN